MSRDKKAAAIYIAAVITIFLLNNSITSRLASLEGFFLAMFMMPCYGMLDSLGLIRSSARISGRDFDTTPRVMVFASLVVLMLHALGTEKVQNMPLTLAMTIPGALIGKGIYLLINKSILERGS